MRVYVSDADEGGSHGADVKQSISDGYGSDISSEINLVQSSLYSEAQVKADMLIAYNAGYELFVSSAMGGSYFLDEAKSYYPEMLCVFPSGANTSKVTANYSIPEFAIITGAGDDDNETGYPIEFFSNDPTTEEEVPDEQDLSSFSNGYIAGQLLKIKDNRGSHWTDAVQSARATSSLNTLELINGYGTIDVLSAIAYSGDIGLVVGGITSVRKGDFNSILTLERIIDATDYEIRVTKNNKLLETVETTSLSNTYTLTYGRYEFNYRGLNGSLTSDWSETSRINYNNLNYIKLK